MKNIFLVAFTLLMVVSHYGFSKGIGRVGSDTLDVFFKVNGTSACKTNIESAITGLDGVLSATWNSSNQTITIRFIADKKQTSDFYSALATAGYDNEGLRAKQVAYDVLQSECKYTRESDNKE